MQNEDPTAQVRESKDHIELAFASQTPYADERFYMNRFYWQPHWYSPASLLFCRPSTRRHHLDISMTGGTEKQAISTVPGTVSGIPDSAWAGVSRSLLTSDEYLTTLGLDPYMGIKPLYANLGIAQVEKIGRWQRNHNRRIGKKLEATMAWITFHINPTAVSGFSLKVTDIMKPYSNHLPIAWKNQIKTWL